MKSKVKKEEREIKNCNLVNKTVFKNVEVGLDICREEHKSAIDRMNGLDTRFNFIFILIASNLALLGAFVDNISTITSNGCMNFFIILVLILNALSIVSIICGIRPRKRTTVDLALYIHGEFYNKTELEFLQTKIGLYNNIVNEINQINKQKSNIFNISVAIIGLAICLTFVLIMLV